MDAFRQSKKFFSFVRNGKQAIKGEHRPLLVESKAARVSSSMDFESALENIDLDCKRFDYFIESNVAANRCHALEVHAFNRSDLIEKKRGTVALLNRHCPDATAEISSWRVLIKGSMPRADIAARFQADTRILLAGRTIDVNKLR